MTALKRSKKKKYAADINFEDLRPFVFETLEKHTFLSFLTQFVGSFSPTRLKTIELISKTIFLNSGKLSIEKWIRV